MLGAPPLPACLPACLPAGLEDLDLGFNRLGRLPPALAAASRLRRLSLVGNPCAALSRGDVDGVLAHMPHLQELMLSSCPSPDVRARLRSILPLLTLK